MRRRMLIVSVLLISVMALSMLVACGDNEMEQVTITKIWRDDEFSAAIPHPETGELFSITDYVKHDRVQYIVTDVGDEDFVAYRQAMCDFGYVEDSVDHDEETGSYSIIFKRDGWRVSLFYGGVNFTIKVYKQGA